MKPLTVNEGLEILLRVIQHVAFNPQALDRIRDKLPSAALRKPKEIEQAKRHMQKVRNRGRGWNHHKKI